MAEPQVDDRRAALEKAFDEAEREANEASTDPAPAEEEPAESAGEPESPKTDGTPPEPEVEEVPVEPQPESPLAAESTGETPREPAAEPETEYTAPVGWRGDAKQKWSDLPKAVQAEVTRREKEIGGVFRESAEARQFQDEFKKTVQPFEGLIASRGSTPLEATRAMMQTQAALMMGTPAQKAGMIAKAIKDYAVDIDQLAAALDAPDSGQPQPRNGNGHLTPEVQQYIQQQMAPFQQMATTWQQQQQQTMEAGSRQAAEDIAAFEADPRYPYLEDVRDTMGDLMLVALQNKRPLTLEQAYNAALSMRPELSPTPTVPTVIPEAEDMATASARRAAAASSIAPRAQPATVSEPKNRREAIEQAWDKEARGG